MSGFSGPVAVTGASGYVASHIVRELLSRGATVHATVRDPGDDKKVGHLTKLAADLPGKLHLFAADLLKEGSFTDAFRDATIVLHTASPFILGATNDPQKTLVDPALQGTRNALAAAAAAPNVTRVVLTSSVVAIHGDPSDAAKLGRPLTEDDWNTTSTLQEGAYAYSKVVAEREAWKLAEGQKYKLVVVNPAFVMGPSLTSRNDSASIDFLVALCDGTRRTGIWEFHTPWVDVRDVAVGHVEAALRPDAEGRHALVAENTGIWHVIGILKERYGDKLKLPLFRVPKVGAYAIGPFLGFSWHYTSTHVDQAFAIDNSKSKSRLGLQYRPLADTMCDHVDQLLRDGLLKV